MDAIEHGVLSAQKNTEHIRKPRIRNAKGVAEISVDGEHYVTAPHEVAVLMRFALMAQRRINAKDPLELLAREYDRLTDLIEGINCHKATLFLRGDISYEQLVDKSIEAKHNGHPEVISLAKSHGNNLMIDTSDIKEYARTHSRDFPFSVHILRADGRKLMPAHSLLWIQTDEAGHNVCFHKTGPYLDMPFEIATLEDILKPYTNPDSMYLFLIVPLKSETENRAEKQRY